MRIKIDGAPVSQGRLNRWRVKRVLKTARVLGQSVQNSGDAAGMNTQLTEIKLKYSYDEMHALLKARLSLSAFAMRCAATLSGGKRKFATAEIEVDGVSAEAIANNIDKLMLEPSKENDAVNLAACPDHYVLRPSGENVLEVIETCGNSPLPFQFFIVYGDETGVHTPRDGAYEHQSVGTARIKSGAVMGGVRHQFTDTENGFKAKLCVEFPALCPRTIIKAHQMHLACEFSYWFNWIKDNYGG